MCFILCCCFNWLVVKPFLHLLHQTLPHHFRPVYHVLRLLSGSNFDIPTNWRPETQSCINHKVLNKECRSDIVRTLVTLTIAKVGSKPSRSHCQQVARKLILQYPFKDDIGDGYVICLSHPLLYFTCRKDVGADKKSH